MAESGNKQSLIVKQLERELGKQTRKILKLHRAAANTCTSLQRNNPNKKTVSYYEKQVQVMR